MAGSIEELGGPGRNDLRAARQVIDGLTPPTLTSEQDTDHAPSAVDQQLLELAYRASVVAMSRVIQPSLLDFLR